MTGITVFLAVLLIIVCLALIGLVLLQDSKSGLGGLMGGASTGAFGAYTDKALVKATTFLSVAFFVLVVSLLLASKGQQGYKSVIEEAKVTTSSDKKEEKDPANLKSDPKAEASSPITKKDEPEASTSTPKKEDVKSTDSTVKKEVLKKDINLKEEAPAEKKETEAPKKDGN